MSLERMPLPSSPEEEKAEKEKKEREQIVRDLNESERRALREYIRQVRNGVNPVPSKEASHAVRYHLAEEDISSGRELEELRREERGENQKRIDDDDHGLSRAA